MNNHGVRQRNSVVAEQIAAKGVRVRIGDRHRGSSSYRTVLLDQTYGVACETCGAPEPKILIDRDGFLLGFLPETCKCGTPWILAVMENGKRLYTFYREDNFV